MNRKEHWDTIYTTKAATEVSWYQPEPQVSLDLIEMASPAHGRIIDVGGGASLLADRLLDASFQKIAVLDISEVALNRAKARMGERAKSVEWIVADVTSDLDLGTFDVWHDRAVFHFLTDERDRRRYVELASRTLPVGGHLIVGTFALDGPPRCSGLEVCRYDAATLGQEFGPGFSLVHQVGHTHMTPTGKPQRFFFGLFRRT
jgi:SAM-dependent methyltransferase